MDVTKTVIPPLPLPPEGLKSTSPAGALSTPDPKWQALLDQALLEIARQTGEPVGRVRDELLVGLLERPGELGEEAMRHLGPRSQRLREELLRLMGRGDSSAGRPDRAPWSLVRCAWIAAIAGVASYPLSVGPVIYGLQRFGIDDATVVEFVYAPLQWLYDAVPWVHAFYDWYLPFFGV